MTAMNTLRSILWITLLAGPLAVLAQYDDVYYDPDFDQGDDVYQYDVRGEDELLFDDGRPSGDTRITNNYYTDDYDYYYSSRLRRFYQPTYGQGYWSNCYTNSFFYNYDPRWYGVNIYVTNPRWGWNNMSPSWGWNNWGWNTRPVTVVMTYNTWGWNNWNQPWGWNNGWGWNQPTAWNGGWNTWNQPWGWNTWNQPWGWNNGWGGGWNNGWNDPWAWNNGWGGGGWNTGSGWREESFYTGPRTSGTSSSGNTSVSNKPKNLGTAEPASPAMRYDKPNTTRDPGTNRNPNDFSDRVVSPPSRATSPNTANPGSMSTPSGTPTRRPSTGSDRATPPATFDRGNTQPTRAPQNAQPNRLNEYQSAPSAPTRAPSSTPSYDRAPSPAPVNRGPSTTPSINRSPSPAPVNRAPSSTPSYNRSPTNRAPSTPSINRSGSPSPSINRSSGSSGPSRSGSPSGGSSGGSNRGGSSKGGR